ncbi:MAG: 50S ribosomal protein L6 [Firmicutes bacterium]|nr:50S ribosomal protein L6 [Bacillota bacterium]
MSRVGRSPIVIPAGVEVDISGTTITIKGKLGELKREINPSIKVAVEGGEIILTRSSDVKQHKSLHGLYRALIANMVKGVSEGWEKTLILNGVGYRAAIAGNKITLNIGYSHPIEVTAPDNLKVELISNTEIKVSGISNEEVGQFAANVRAFRKPEPYHAYGIRYKDEVIIRKEGKTSGKK